MIGEATVSNTTTYFSENDLEGVYILSFWINKSEVFS